MIYGLLFISLLLFVGLRYASVDYFSYEQIYDKQSFRNFSFPFYSASGQTTGNEFLFATIISVFKSFEADFYLFVLFFSFLSIFSKFYVFYKFSGYVFLSLFIYVCLLLSKELGQIRSAASMGFIALAVVSTVRGEPYKFSFWILVAMGIQAASVIFIPFYVAYKFLLNKYFSCIFLLISFFVYQINGMVGILVSYDFGFDNVIFEKLKSYHALQDEVDVGINLFNLLITLFSFFVIYFMKSKRLSDFQEVKGFFCIYVYSVGFYWVFLDVPTVSSRILDVGAIFSLSLIIPFFLSYFKPGTSRFLIYNLFLVVFSVYFLVFSVKDMAEYRVIVGGG